MCAIYCWACKDAGTVRTWGGAVPCLCVGLCENCGRTDTTERHRRACRPWPVKRS